MTETTNPIPASEAPEFGSLRLLSGIATGMFLRADELARPRLAAVAERANVAAAMAADTAAAADADASTGPGASAAPATSAEQFRYFVTGLLLWAPVSMAQGAYRGVRFSLDASQRAVRAAGGLTDNPLLRPFRRPLERQLARLEPFAHGLIDLGRRESARSKALADQAVAEAVDAISEFIAASPEVQRLIDGILAYAGRSPELHPLVDGVIDYASESEAVDRLVDDVLRYVVLSPRFSLLMDYIIQRASESPELAALIQTQLNQQATGLTGVVADNARNLTVIGDGVLEAVVRRILRQTPRRMLPPSPLVGQPQTMYKAAAFKPGKITHKVVGNDDGV